MGMWEAALELRVLLLLGISCQRQIRHADALSRKGNHSFTMDVEAAPHASTCLL